MLQAPIDYHGLRETGILKTRAGYQLLGLCYSNSKVYTLEINKKDVHLAVYQMNGDSGNLILMDSMDVGLGLSLALLTHLNIRGPSRGFSPSIDRHSHRIFLSAHHGVLVARLEGDKLVKERILQSVHYLGDVVVMPLDTLYVCDWTYDTVCIIDGMDDMVTGTLETPQITWGVLTPYSLAAQGDSVLVCYNDDSKTMPDEYFESISAKSEYFLVIYRHGSLIPARILCAPDITGGEFPPHLLIADSEGHALLAQRNSDTSRVININVDVYHVNHKIKVNTDSVICGCTIVNRQLWMACGSGDIVIMSSGK